MRGDADRAWARGDCAGAIALLESTIRAAVSMAARRAGSHLADDDLRDLHQAGRLRLWLCRDQYAARHGAALSSWAYRVVYNVAISELRALLRARNPLATFDSADVAERVMCSVEDDSPTADPTNDLVAEQTRREVEKALAEVERYDARAYVRHLVAGMTYAQIAEAHGVPLGTVRSRIKRLRDRLEVRLGEA